MYGYLKQFVLRTGHHKYPYKSAARAKNQC